MARCPHCGILLDEPKGELTQCPACGEDLAPLDGGKAFIASYDDLDDIGPTVPLEAQLTLEDRLSIASSEASDFGFNLPTTVSSSRTTLVGLGVGLGLAVLIVLLCTLAAFSSVNFNPSLSVHAQSPSTPVTRPQGPTPTSSIFSFPTQVADPTPLPFTGQIPTVAPTQTPFGGEPTATPQGGLTPTPSPGGSQPRLQASPISCAPGNRAATFTLQGSNFGSSTLTWTFVSANPSSYATLPQSGTLSSERPSQEVVVGNSGNVIGSFKIIIGYDGSNHLTISGKC